MRAMWSMCRTAPNSCTILRSTCSPGSHFHNATPTSGTRLRRCGLTWNVQPMVLGIECLLLGILALNTPHYLLRFAWRVPRSWSTCQMKISHGSSMSYSSVLVGSCLPQLLLMHREKFLLTEPAYQIDLTSKPGG